MTHLNQHGSRMVWDRFVRLFHWTLVICIALDYFVVDAGTTLHRWIGYGACALICARIVWGFIGTRYALFSDFFPTPARLMEHLRGLKNGNAKHQWGHNPLGALMILALIFLVLGLGLTGWMQTLDRYFGEEWLQSLHELLGDALISLAALHALAAIAMSRIERTNLVKAMVTGIKERW